MKIMLTRGDTLNLQVSLTDSNGVYQMQPGDKLVFTLKENVYSEQIVLQKNIIDGCFTIEHQDTKNINYGSYVYDIQLTMANGNVCTVVKPSLFTITEEVNYGD